MKRPHHAALGILASLFLVLLIGLALVVGAAYEIKKHFFAPTPSYAPDTLYSLAVQQVQRGDYTVAEKYLQQALQAQDDSTYRNQLAVVEYRLRKYPEAIDQYQLLVTKGGDKAFAYNGIGNAYRDWGPDHYADAETAYRQAFQADSQYAAAYSNLTLLLVQEGKRDAALAIINQGIAATQQPELTALKANI